MANHGGRLSKRERRKRDRIRHALTLRLGTLRHAPEGMELDGIISRRDLQRLDNRTFYVSQSSNLDGDSRNRGEILFHQRYEKHTLRNTAQHKTVNPAPRTLPRAKRDRMGMDGQWRKHIEYDHTN